MGLDEIFRKDHVSTQFQLGYQIIQASKIEMSIEFSIHSNFIYSIIMLIY